MRAAILPVLVFSNFFIMLRHARNKCLLILTACAVAVSEGVCQVGGVGELV